MIVCDADAAGMNSTDEVLEAAQRDYVSERPGLDHQVRGDEGEGADYLFTWLRSIRAVLQEARAKHLAVAHVLEY